MANLKDILNAAGEISLYASDPEWKNKRMAQIRAQQAHDAMLAKSTAETAAIPERVDIAEQRNFLQQARDAERNIRQVDQIEKIVATYPEEMRAEIRARLLSAAQGNALKDAGTVATTGLVDEKTAGAKIDNAAKPEVIKGKNALTAARTAAALADSRRPRGGGGPKAPTASRLGADLRAAQNHLLKLQDKEQTGLLIAGGGPKAIASAQAEVDRLQRLVSGGEASNTGGKKSGGIPNLAFAESKRPSMVRQYATMTPENRLKAEAEMAPFVKDPKAWLSGR